MRSTKVPITCDVLNVLIKLELSLTPYEHAKSLGHHKDDIYKVIQKYEYNIDKFSEREPNSQEYQGDIK